MCFDDFSEDAEGFHAVKVALAVGEFCLELALHGEEVFFADKFRVNAVVFELAGAVFNDGVEQALYFLEWFGKVHAYPGKVDVLDVRFDVRVFVRSDFYGFNAEIGADFFDFCGVASWAGGEGKDARPLGEFEVLFGEEDVAVVAGGAVCFVEDEQADFVEVDFVANDVVFESLWG